MKKSCWWCARTILVRSCWIALVVALAVIAVPTLSLGSDVSGTAPFGGSPAAADLSRAEASRGGEGFNEAVQEFVMHLQQQLPASSWSGSFLVGRYVVVFDSGKTGSSLWSSNFFDRLVPSSAIPTKELRSRTVIGGYGVPFTGVRDATPERQVQEPFSMRGMTIAPVTVTVTFEPGDKNGATKAIVRLWNPFNATAGIAGDFSAPTEFVLEQQPDAKIARLALFNPGEYKQVQGLGMLTPFQPGKIPVVLVHGLDSLPRTWQDVYNELIADPIIRARYQFWVYRYPTGVPVPVSSTQFRKALQAARAQSDPSHKDKALDRMVLVGHSMGGLLSRMMVTESGDVFWRQLSDVPLENMNLPAEDKAYLSNMVFFHPQPFVKRVVFIATPHRGSSLASGSLGGLARKVIKAPVELTGLTSRAAAALPPGLSSGFEQLTRDMPTSVDSLSPDNRFVLTLQAQPIHVPHHSIIGTQGVLQGGKPITDGIVPYWSSHLSTAESEVWVNSGHGAHQNPDAICELRRILLLHLAE